MNVIIALGSNLGEREQYIENGIREIDKRIGTVLKRASLMETAPYGVEDQPSFLNTAVSVETELDPEEIIHTLLEIEKEQDRVRIRHWGPRTLDLDIIYCEDRLIRSEDLIVPHPDRLNRDFVLGPIAEIAPEFIDPEEHKTIADLWKALQERT